MDERQSPRGDRETTPYDLKELLIESYTREWRPEYFLEVVPFKSLEVMSMLDSSALEAGAHLYSGPDLFAALHHEISSKGRETWFKQHIMTLLQDVEFRSKVDAQINEDLRDAGLPHLMGRGRRMSEKAIAIAEYRLKRNASLLRQPNQPVEAPNTFKVTLRTLVGGHGGLIQESNLYFNYTTSFPLFLVMLRDGTKLSTIPPIGRDEESAVRRGSSSEATSDTASQSSSTHLSQQNQERSRDRNSERGSETSLYIPSTPSGPNPPPKARKSSDGGYTLADGPWLYRFTCESRRKGDKSYVRIKDEQSFLKMRDSFKEVTGKDPSNKYTVLLIHSMDSRALDRWRKNEREDEIAEEHFRETCRRELVCASDYGDSDCAVGPLYDEADLDIGESYMDWLTKDLARQEEERQNPQGQH